MHGPSFIEQIYITAVTYGCIDTVNLEKIKLRHYSPYCIYLAALGKKRYLLIWTHFKSICPKMPVSKFNLKRPVIVEKKILNVVNAFHFFAIDHGVVPQLSNLSPNDALWHVWLKLILRFCRRWKCETFMTTSTLADISTLPCNYDTQNKNAFNCYSIIIVYMV